MDTLKQSKNRPVKEKAQDIVFHDVKEMAEN
jgi:hypothetical protein